ncbi:Sau3AI family type II restriction endonuclease [Lysinibacillus endophyticus]|uniref:Sau3AI family type II restriction endonuclease n=1 Tax=Ureibacillus endophyticus TaxID=1978490 RepID=UPI0020A1FF0E|nr:Sau3AI family type II restriction endonuclease [Lysinibacillus endophyticus]MCP1144616.1 DNA mismatch repair protein MutH [Lysinibacillus endophyticus]
MFVYNKDISEEDLLIYAAQLEGKKLRDIGDFNEVNKWLSKSKNKGAIGNAIQVVYFGIPANSVKEADFNYHNLELKVTPIKRNKNKTYSSKERLVLNMINYETDFIYEFEESPLMKKSQHMLLIFYLHEEDVDVFDYKILKAVKFTIPKEDLPTIREDYYTIINKIKEGKAHQISESDTTYLAACTKGAGHGKDERKQPFSKELARQRAFSFKQKYMSVYFNAVFNTQTLEKLNMPVEVSFSAYINNILLPFTNLTTKEIEEKLNYKPTKGITEDKSYLPKLVSKIFGIAGTNLENIEQFQKGNVKFKTIRLRQKASDNQDMSWPNINFDEIYNVDFEDSTWYEWFAETKYLFVVFEDTDEGTFLRNHILWNAPPDMLEALKKLYNHIKWQLHNDVIEVEITTDSKGKEVWKNNLPGKGFVPYFQIRPKGNKGSEFTTLPDGRKFKKQCLFLNKEYLRELILS